VDGVTIGEARNPQPTVLRPRPLVGRDREIHDVTESIASAPVTTLVGPGGVGKTALAINVAAACAADFPDGVTVVWLASVRSAELVAAEVAAQLGMQRSGGQSYEDALALWLNERDVLLLIDNCEHVVSAVADLVDALTVRLPRLRVLATSREPLWIDGEMTYRLAPLPVVGAEASIEEVSASPSVQLFKQRAGTRGRGVLDAERAGRIFGEICRRVDGLPLAIELAAARVAGLDLEDIASHLDDLFNLLPQAARRADGGRRSLRATVEWSDALLTPEERRLLHRMAVFAGPFELTAVKDVCATDAQTAAQIANLTARLVEKSLLLKLGDSGRYQLLETIRQYSLEQLGAANEIEAIRERHARFYLAIGLHEGAATLTGPERPHLEVLRRIEENTRVALECLLKIEPAAALQLASSLNMFWWTQGKLGEGIRWLSRARELTPDAPAELRAASLFCEAFLVAHDTDDWHAAAKLLDLGLAAVEGESEPPLILGMLMCLRAECDVFNGDPHSAVIRTSAGREIAALYPGSWGYAFSTWNAAFARLRAGDESSAIALFTEMLELTEKCGYNLADMCGCNVMGEIWEARGELDKSRAFWERALRLRRELGAIRIGHVHGSMPTALLAVARVAAKQGDLTTASKMLREGLPLAEEMREVGTAQQMTELLRQTSQVEPTQRATLRPEGGVWHIAFNGKSVHVPDFKGFWHLRELVSRPREAVSALSLIAAPSEDPILIGDAGPQLDREALRRYRTRLAELDEELDDAEAQHDLVRHATGSAERDALLKEIARATGLGGKPRRTGSPAEKARLNVTRTIRHAVTYLSSTAPELAAHLDDSLVTGISCCYEPRTNVVWST
jgi:predicted ATPase